MLELSKLSVISMEKICKNFGEFKANDNVDFELEVGEIHALLGENGAGKSTLMNILYGLYTPTSGQIYINGQPKEINTPKDAIINGIGMVHQHFMLIPQLTVTQNIFLGMKESGFIFKKKELEKKVADMCKKFDFRINPSDFIWQLPVGVQQKVEILKILMRDAKILILDEPTAVLTPAEVVELFASLKKLVNDGYSAILITHRMEEVLSYSDRITVMRQGKVISTVETKNTNEEELATMMVGRQVFNIKNLSDIEKGEVLFQIKNYCVNNDWGTACVKDISFEIRSGEILGILGVDGNGQLELGEALMGMRRVQSGSKEMDSCDITNHSPKKLIDMGVSQIPDDRHKKGLVLDFSVLENFLLGSQRDKKNNKRMFLKYKDYKLVADDLSEKFDIRLRNTGQLVKDLSGGNQQKVILARELSRNPKFILAIQPTRGLDIGAIEFVRTKILEEKAKGKAILLISTDLQEILALSDRIAVIFEGKIIKIVKPTAPIEEIGLLMSGSLKKEVI